MNTVIGRITKSRNQNIEKQQKGCELFSSHHDSYKTKEGERKEQLPI